MNFLHVKNQKKMKKILLALTCSFFATFILAQTTPESAIPTVGDSIVSQLADATGFDQGASGDGVNWDYSTLQPAASSFPVVTHYITPESTPFATDFAPLANLASFSTFDGDTTYNYFRSSPNSLLNLGFANNVAKKVYDDSEFLYAAALGQGDNLPDDFSATLTTDFSQTFTTGNTNISYDGSGTLDLPSGTFTDVVKVMVQTQSRDSSKLGPTIESITTIDLTSYQWFKANIPGPLMTFSISSVSSETRIIGTDTTFTGPTITTSISYLPDAMDVVSNTEEVTHSIVKTHSIYPNPAKNQATLTFELKEAIDGTISIFDLSGRNQYKMEWQGLSGQQSIQIPTDQLNPGLYLVALESGEEVFTQKLSIDR